ncbi:MAG: FtsX-like permease family protein [Planctomycetota bacterium]
MSLVRHAAFLAQASIRHAKLRNALLALALGVSLGLPVALAALLGRASDDLRARTAIAPLVLGARGSESDLVFGAMYFAARPAAGLRLGDVGRVEADALGMAVPIAVGASARGAPVVGTTLDYLDRRGIAVSEGAAFATVGDCVVGARAARTLGLGVGSRLFTDPAALADLAGVYPLELVVTGVLAASDSPDDDAIFVDLATHWTVVGLGHRHDDAAASATPGAVIGSDGRNTIAGEALPIERGAAGAVAPDFHFHGAREEFPISAALVYPRDAKAQAILLGRFTSRDEPLQLVRPDQFADRVLDRIFGVGRVLGAIAAGTAALVALVATTTFALSIRLRADELALMKRLGASRARVAAFLAFEAAVLLASAALVAAAVAATAPLFADAVLRAASGG